MPVRERNVGVVNEAVYLGVDGGGTKTEFVLIDQDLRVRSSWTGPSCYYFGTSMQLVRQVLQQGVDRVTKAAGVLPTELTRAFFALPGYGEASSDIVELNQIAGEVLRQSRYDCGNDTIAGWAGSLAGEDGVNVVAGTGSITYGEREGRTQRVGGWGEIFGDEGSAYWIAVRALNMFSRMSDGRALTGPLHHLLRTETGADPDLDLVSIVHDSWNGSRSRIAGLAKIVDVAAQSGDSAAAHILHTAGVELAEMVNATRVALGYEPSETCLVSYSGGVFNASSVRDAFNASLMPNCELRAPLHRPAVGAAIYAAKREGIQLS